jgi:hypothetical protein
VVPFCLLVCGGQCNADFFCCWFFWNSGNSVVVVVWLFGAAIAAVVGTMKDRCRNFTNVFYGWPVKMNWTTWW